MLAQRKRKQGRPGERERWIQREGLVPRKLVTRGTVLGAIHIGTAKLMVLRWIRGPLLTLFLISVQSV